MTYRTLGIVLRRRDVREYDRLYTIYTREHGKIEALVRGSRKMVSKLSPHLESFATVDLLIAKGRMWDHVAGVECVERFGNINSRYLPVAAVLYAYEATDALTKFGLRDAALWNLMIEYIRTLNNLPDGTSVISLREVLRAYICQLLARLGVAPELDKCQNCKQTEALPVELAASGVLCASCAAIPRRDQSIALTAEDLVFLRNYHHEPLQSFISDERSGRADRAPFAVNFLLKTQIGAALKTEKFFSLA